ncbi:hypothetical protein PBI_PAEDORE_27 [Streptomyces phage Paedore]|uniref:Uncharacterized protein n=1 Tax=Streptomyces phage Paedore TaxID=2108134 RepID=A0A2P1JTN9_9CAUD|nr:hypothetical protein KGG91_gp27 [Streptomyces phage Paedore]AVO22510.1 hypothetical protein PBI_PAEDORE_27 [Streptomyces phage Paedore]
MSKHRRVSAKGRAVITRYLPTKYKSKAGLIASLAGVALSVAVLFTTDHPQIAVAIQALTAFGFVENSDSE